MDQPLLSGVVLIVCLVVLARSADALVDVVVVLSHKLDLPEGVAGATLAAAATSAPEFGTTVFSLLRSTTSPGGGAENIGIGTVLGSAVFNLAMILGVVGLLGGTPIERKVLSRDGLAYALSVIALILALGFGPTGLSRSEGIGLLAGYALYMLWIARDTKAARGAAERPSVESEQSSLRAWFRLVWIILIVGVACHYLVVSTAGLARNVADLVSVSNTRMISILSLVVVAAGSSLPDLFTSVSALKKGRGSLAVGNAIGSNTFDLLVCVGLPYAVMGGRAVASEVVYAGWYLLATVVVFLGLFAGVIVLSLTHQIFHTRELWSVLGLHEAMLMRLTAEVSNNGQPATQLS